MYEYQFVDAISATPTVRLSLARPTWRVLVGTTFGMPELDRATVATLLVDGERYPAAAYTNRALMLVIRVDAADDDATAAALQSLYRELDRPTNILRYRPGTSEAVFFRTFRAPPNAVVWEPHEKRVTATVPAEPFALGLKQTVGPTSVSNDPASGCYLDLTGVRGDVETPLYLSLGPASGVGASFGNIAAFAVRRRGTPSAAPWVLQAESMTAGTGAVLQPNDAAMSGSGQNYMQIGFASPAAQSRLSVGSWPSASSTDIRGTYRVFGRFRKTVAGDSIQVKWRLSWGATPAESANGDEYTLPSTTNIVYQDLGLVQLPYGVDPGTDGLSGAELPVAGVTVQLVAGRTSGSGSLDVDLLLFVPADDRFAVVELPGEGSPSAIVLDADRTRVYAVGASGQVVTTDVGKIAGGLPMISPGVTNRVYYVRDVGGVSGDAVAASTPVTAYYWPRYLYVAAVGS